jgi:hypothetical protein
MRADGAVIAVTMLLWTLLWADPARAGGIDAAESRVRGVSREARALIDDTARGSAAVRDLLARLACTDVIVYVEFTASPDIPIARTKLVTAVPGARFVRIGISARVSILDLGPTLAHELQHAVEIAEHDGARDDDEVRRLFERIGIDLGGDRFETRRAREVELIVRGELRHRIGG